MLNEGGQKFMQEQDMQLDDIVAWRGFSRPYEHFFTGISVSSTKRQGQCEAVGGVVKSEDQEQLSSMGANKKKNPKHDQRTQQEQEDKFHSH